jgi:hypothetical protein
MHSYLSQEIARQTIGCLVAGAVAAAEPSSWQSCSCPPSLSQLSPPGQRPRRPVKPKQPKARTQPKPNRTPSQQPGNPRGSKPLPHHT